MITAWETGMRRTLREYEPGLSSCMRGSRRFKGMKRNGVVVGSDGMVATKAEGEWDRQYKKHASRLERRTAKTEMTKEIGDGI